MGCFERDNKCTGTIRSSAFLYKDGHYFSGNIPLQRIIRGNMSVYGSRNISPAGLGEVRKKSLGTYCQEFLSLSPGMFIKFVIVFTFYMQTKCIEQIRF